MNPLPHQPVKVSCTQTLHHFLPDPELYVKRVFLALPAAAEASAQGPHSRCNGCQYFLLSSPEMSAGIYTGNEQISRFVDCGNLTECRVFGTAAAAPSLWWGRSFRPGAFVVVVARFFFSQGNRCVRLQIHSLHAPFSLLSLTCLAIPGQMFGAGATPTHIEEFDTTQRKIMYVPVEDNKSIL